jgi:hypothetical protein
MLDSLAEQNPTVVEYQVELGQVLFGLAQLESK